MCDIAPDVAIVFITSKFQKLFWNKKKELRGIISCPSAAAAGSRQYPAQSEQIWPDEAAQSQLAAHLNGHNGGLASLGACRWCLATRGRVTALLVLSPKSMWRKKKKSFISAQEGDGRVSQGCFGKQLDGMNGPPLGSKWLGGEREELDHQNHHLHGF